MLAILPFQVHEVHQGTDTYTDFNSCCNGYDTLCVATPDKEIALDLHPAMHLTVVHGSAGLRMATASWSQ
jgi:hypothetical protein